MGVSVPRRRMRRVTGPDTILNDDDFDWTLSVGALSYQRLHRTLGEFGVFMRDSEDELAQHPYYKVGRPGGCMVLCQIAVAYYSTHTPPAEIERLTSYDFSCFTRFNPCARIVDLLPAAEEWRLYDSEYESGPTVPFPKERPLTEPMPKPTPCSNIPVWAMARDARYVLAVEALSTKIVKVHEDYGEYYREVAKVRVLSSLREPPPWLAGAIVSTDNAYFGKEDDLPSSEGEHLVPGRRYIVFAIGNDRRDQIVTKDSPVRFERCGVQEDTPEMRRELEKGFAQNDTLNP